MDESKIEAIIEAVVRQLGASAPAVAEAPAVPPPTRVAAPSASPSQPAAGLAVPKAEQHALGDLIIDLDDPATTEARRWPGIPFPSDPEALPALMETTTARIGVGRSGPRARTESLLLFQADLAITKDALARTVAPSLLAEFGLFTVRTMVSGGREEYLLRPDLGRRLSEEAKKEIEARCVKEPDIQVCVGDGLSAQAIEANLRKIFPVLKSGCAQAGLSLGTPFFIERCRVGVMNDLGDILRPKVLVLLIGERPGLGRADSMSAYMGYRPKAGHSDADRDVICNIYDGGGVNPLEAGAYAVRLALRMITREASGVRLRLLEEEG